MNEMSTDYEVGDCTGDGTTSPWNIDDGIGDYTNERNGYSFVSANICEQVFETPLRDWCWSTMKEEIDAGRPFVWSQGVA